MYKKILVKELIEEGQQLLGALARTRFFVTAALWFYIPESLEWRLVIITPTVDQGGPIAAYTRLQRILTSISPSQLTFTDISLMSPFSQDYQNLQAGFKYDPNNERRNRFQRFFPDRTRVKRRA
jgi:hypothetical protein